MNLPGTGRGTGGAGGGGVRHMLRPETAVARSLRKDMSLSEVLLWQQLRGRKAGVKFRRQHPIGPYVVDFYCSHASLIVEIDGEAHSRGEQPVRDRSRDQFLEENGYRVLRIAAAEVLRNVEAVVASVVAHAEAPLHHSPAASGPPPRAGEV
jgi:very-short-patch-repair endonuclease